MNNAEQAKRFIVRVETLTSRGVTPEYTASMFSLWDHSRLPEYQHIWIIPPRIQVCSDIPLGRNQCIKRDMAELNWDAWLWIDDDHEFAPEVLYSLVDAMQRGSVDIVAPLMGAKGKEKPGLPMIMRDYDKDQGLWNIMYTGWEQPDLYEVAAVGTGFQLVSRRVFETMPEPWYDRRINPKRQDRIQGNDLVFSQKAKEMGFRIWLDSRVEIGHMRNEAIYVRKHFLESGFQEHELVRIASTKPIEEYKGEDVNSQELWDGYWSGRNWLWREKREEMAKALSYRIGQGSKVLHFGCGEGWLSNRIQELSEGTTVKGLDHSVAAISLARRRGIDCQYISKMSGFEANGQADPSYDYILVTDWMERLRDPEGTVRELVRSYGKPGTQLLCMYPAMTLGPHHQKEFHHVWSEFTVGEFVSRFGKPLEVELVKEQLPGPEGGVMDVDRIISRSTVDKIQQAAGVV